jgi:hypothetical protein
LFIQDSSWSCNKDLKNSNKFGWLNKNGYKNLVPTKTLEKLWVHCLPPRRLKNGNFYQLWVTGAPLRSQHWLPQIGETKQTIFETSEYKTQSGDTLFARYGFKKEHFSTNSYSYSFTLCYVNLECVELEGKGAPGDKRYVLFRASVSHSPLSIYKNQCLRAWLHLRVQRVREKEQDELKLRTIQKKLFRHKKKPRRSKFFHIKWLKTIKLSSKTDRNPALGVVLWLLRTIVANVKMDFFLLKGD